MSKNLNIIILSILTCLFLGKNCIKSYAQDSTPTLAYQIVQVKPTFNKGDLRTFSKWLSRQIIYPDIATSRGIEGKVIIQFTVQTDGTVNNVKVLRGVDPLIDNEAIRVVKKIALMASW